MKWWLRVRITGSRGGMSFTQDVLGNRMVWALPDDVFEALNDWLRLHQHAAWATYWWADRV